MLLAVFCFSFLFRATMVFHNQYPPSSDIGLHGGIINQILDQETLPTWNPYHMGGEPLVTPPGFHFFASILILLTGMPVILAELIAATFYSSVIVFPAYLVSKRIWKDSNAGLLAAFFAAISALSIEMLCWGGYTNIVSLFLIITIFYFFLRDIDKPTIKHLLMGTLLFGTLIITHPFSLSVFLPILAIYLVLLIVGKLGKLKEMRILNMLRFFVVSAALGTALVSLWLLQVINFYFNALSEGAFTGGLDNRNLILANCRIDPIILTLVVVIIPALIMLKDSRKRYFDMSSLLLIAWFLAPIVMTQAYVFSIYTHYSRFVYFIDFPVIVIVSAVLLYLSRFSTLAINRFAKIRWTRIQKALPVIAFTIIIFGFIISSSWSMFPHEGMKETNIYSTIQQPEATALEWIRSNTPKGSVLVADHTYGWWLSGIAERPTLSAAGLEFLIYSYEQEVAKNAQLLLDTDYFVDNGLIQVKEDGPYLSRHNTGFSIKKWSRESYSMIYFQDNQITLCYYRLDEFGNKNYENITLSEIKDAETSMVSDEDSATITVTRENSLLKVERTLTVHRGVRFAELTYQIETEDAQTNVFDVEVVFNTTKGEMTSEQGMVGVYDQNQKACAQVIFKENTPTNITPQQEETEQIKLQYSFSENQTKEMNMLVGVFDAKDLSYPEINETYQTLVDSAQEVVSSEPLIAWGYLKMVEDYNVSYVVCRDRMIYPKFSEDSKFRLVFNSGGVAVFQVVN